MSVQIEKVGRASGKASMAARIRLIREEFRGAVAVDEFAGRLGLPTRTWLNYEQGVTMPGETMLRCLLLTGAEPLWLLEGLGPRYRETNPSP